MQEKEPLKKLLEGIQTLNNSKNAPKPVFLKIAPDLSNHQIDEVSELIELTRLTGLIVSNTTISRTGLKTNSLKIERIGMGGLSGLPLKHRSTEIINYLIKVRKVNFHIIGVGGIHSADDAIEKFEAGASLIQLYTGFIYEGPGLVKKINLSINRYLKQKTNTIG